MTKGTIQNKDSFLANIASHLHRPKRDRTKPIERPKRMFTPEKEVLTAYEGKELLPFFYKECENILTDVVEVNSDQLEEKLQELVKEHGEGKVVTPKDDRFQSFGLEAFVQEPFVHEWDIAKGKENISIAEQAQTGIMFSDITLAESATMIMFNDKDIPRAVGLLPETFIGIIPLSTMVPRFTQASEEINRRIEAGETIASCVNFISGPSNSADIESNLVVGVHGPVKATYIVVMDK